MRSVLDVNDWTLITHMETEHFADLRQGFQPEPDREFARLAAPTEWRTFHDTLHRLHPNRYDHQHEEPDMEAQPLKFHDKQEPVWVVTQTGHGTPGGIVGVGVSELATPDLPGLDKTKPFHSTKTILYRPSLAPIYGGPTLLEALWEEMDRLMESLMTGVENAEDSCSKRDCAEPDPTGEPCGHPDNGDKYRAQELAWVLAIVTNAYEPDVNGIRAEAMRRWNEANGIEPLTEDDSADEEINTRPEGADQ